MTWTGWTVLRGLLIVCLLAWLCGSAHAIMVGATPNVIPNTATAPADDPGFLNAAKTGSFVGGVCTGNCFNSVYLGDGWILSAKHTGLTSVQFDHLATLFAPIPNQAFVIPNPTGLGLTDYTDLRIYRVKGDAANMDPGLPSLTIASQPPLLDGSIGAEVVMIGNGVNRAAAESHYSVNSANPPVWTEVASSSTYNGYKSSGQGKRWGTNHIADDNAVLQGESDTNLTANINAGPGDVISYLTVYDQNSPNPYEAQAVGGDSGSPVFYNRNGQWELTGIIHGNLIYPGQHVLGGFNSSNTLAIYGNGTAFADLSSYRSQILAIMNAHTDYSIMGDVNLDGVVSGNGAGPVATDDISAFVAGWRYDNGTTAGNITSWTKGDLNRDGQTDATDFFKLRQACSASASCSPSGGASAMALLLGIAVPEPTTVSLALLSAGILFAAPRRRRSRPTV